jgi:hypothetical protein
MLSAKQSALNTARSCQGPELRTSSASYPRFRRLRLLSWYMRREGLFGALRRMAIGLVPALRVARRNTASLQVWEDEIQNLQPDERVEVKSRDEILPTLDQNSKHRGLPFVPRLYDFSGRRSVFSGGSRKSASRTRPAIRQIEYGSARGGESVRGGCDRACFHCLAGSMATQSVSGSFDRHSAFGPRTTSCSTLAFLQGVRHILFSRQPKWHFKSGHEALLRHLCGFPLVEPFVGRSLAKIAIAPREALQTVGYLSWIQLWTVQTPCTVY